MNYLRIRCEMMKVIGITGGIGSGKSLVTKIMEEKYGALVLNTDGIAREQMDPGGVSYREVVAFFGQGILAEDGTIDRHKLSLIVFEDREKLNKLNAITHPKVLVEVRKEIDRHRKLADIPYLIIETALMIESGYDFVCDEVWYVYAPEERRREWLKISRSYTDEKIDSIFGNQSKEEAFRQKFPKAIENIGNIEFLEQQVEKLLSKE
jgi:dephospho-CoA kinase